MPRAKGSPESGAALCGRLAARRAGERLSRRGGRSRTRRRWLAARVTRPSRCRPPRPRRSAQLPRAGSRARGRARGASARWRCFRPSRGGSVRSLREPITRRWIPFSASSAMTVAGRPSCNTVAARASAGSPLGRLFEHVAEPVAALLADRVAARDRPGERFCRTSRAQWRHRRDELHRCLELGAPAPPPRAGRSPSPRSRHRPRRLRGGCPPARRNRPVRSRPGTASRSAVARLSCQPARGRAHRDLMSPPRPGPPRSLR